MKHEVRLLLKILITSNLAGASGGKGPARYLTPGAALRSRCQSTAAEMMRIEGGICRGRWNGVTSSADFAGRAFAPLAPGRGTSDLQAR